jgi:hypothetical protein
VTRDAAKSDEDRSGASVMRRIKTSALSSTSAFAIAILIGSGWATDTIGAGSPGGSGGASPTHRGGDGGGGDPLSTNGFGGGGGGGIHHGTDVGVGNDGGKGGDGDKDRRGGAGGATAGPPTFIGATSSTAPSTHRLDTHRQMVIGKFH